MQECLREDRENGGFVVCEKVSEEDIDVVLYLYSESNLSLLVLS
jgi:hypothetical protein